MQKLAKRCINFTGDDSYLGPRSVTEKDILLITSSNYLMGLQEYISFKEKYGYSVEVELTDNIYLEYPGQDNAESIRNCIIHHYTNSGIEYVILAGDADPANPIIPHRGFAAYDDNDIPADMYYACLDGNWNDDQDNKWGEPGEDDLLAEISIGRLCFDSETELQNIIQKLIRYQDTPVVEDIEKALMLGENLDNVPTWGGDSKDEIANGSSNFEITTAGLPQDYTITFMYDRDMQWNKYNVFKEFSNQGTHLLNHLGHSNVTYNMKMDNPDITTSNFTNDGLERGLVIGYSQGCYNGSFDNRGTSPGSYGGDCFAEVITTIETAEVASIANSRYGWYSPGNTNGPSQFFDREFFDAIYGEDIFTIGTANADSKEDNIGYIQADMIGRWCAYELNVLGDPSMEIWTAEPVEIAVAHASSIIAGSTSFPVYTDVPLARVAMIQNGTLIGKCIADSSGVASLVIESPVTSTDSIMISVSAHNHFRKETVIGIAENQALIVFSGLSLNDSNGNGVADYGETISLDVTMVNSGDQPAENIDVTISTEDEFVSITDGAEHYGSLSVGEQKTVASAFTFTVDSISPIHTSVIDITASDGVMTWHSGCLVNIHAPDLHFDGFTVDDSQANNNGRIDPGETVNLLIDISNRGNSEAFGVYTTLFEDCDYLTLQNQVFPLQGLLPEEQKAASFTIMADESCPEGTTAFFALDITASGGIVSEEEFSTYIGQPPVLVMDLDQNHNSGPVMMSALNDVVVGAEYFTSFPDDLSKYQAIFVCLGTMWNNHQLNNAEGYILANYLESGGNLYMEGGGTWWYDYATPVHPYFNIDGEFGTLELGKINGVEGTFTNGMIFNYEGDSLYWDKIIPIEPAYLVLENSSPSQGLAAAHDAGSYRTIGSSIEFGGLTDGASPSTRAKLMYEYLAFFGIAGMPVGVEQVSLTDASFEVYPNPLSGQAYIQFEIDEPSRVRIELYDIMGRCLGCISDQFMTEGSHITHISTNSLHLRQGPYILKMIVGNSISSKRILVAGE